MGKPTPFSRRVEQFQNAAVRQDALSAIRSLPIAREFDADGNPLVLGLWTWAVIMSMN